MAIGGTTAGLGYSQLQITGTATLGGSLVVANAAGYTPPSSTTWTMLTFASYSSSFSSVSWSTTHTTTYNSGNFELLTMADVPPEDEDEGPLDATPREDWSARVFVRAEVERWDAGVADDQTEEASRSDLVFTALADESDEAWMDAGTWEDLLTLPLAVIEELVEVVA